MAKLTGGDYFHIHSLMETTLSFFAGYDTRIFPQYGRREKKELLQQSSTVTQTYFRCRAVYASSVHYNH